MPDPLEPLPTPFVVVTDTREQRPYTFAGLVSDARQGNRPLLVRTAVRGLPSGDYSVEGHEQEVAVERKSLADLYGTLGQGRERFERELERLAEYDFAAVVVEAEWSQILTAPVVLSHGTRMHPKSVYRSVLAWQQRYHRVHWLTVPGREMGEVTTFRILERYWRDRHDG